MKNEDVVSIIIATFNSGKLLRRTLDAIKEQTYPAECIEIMIIDGGSEDDTIKIAEEYGCVICHNEKTDPVNAKIIGFNYSQGKYMMTIDHDEVLVNQRAIENRINALKKHPECKVALGSGYLRPANYPLLNQYISDYGDPFSMFVYSFPKCYKHQEKKLRSRYYIEDIDNYMIVDFSLSTKPAIYELVCGSVLIEKEYFRLLFQNKLSAEKIGQAFYMMLEDGYSKVVFAKDDPLLHYSADSLKAYFPKLKWRICNNVHFAEMETSGFSGRSNFQKNTKYKKIMFIPYTISTIVPILHGVICSISRKNPIYMLHFVFCWYVLIQILWQYLLKITGNSPRPKSYDGKMIIQK